MSYVDLDVVLETAAKENKNILSFKLFQVQCQEFCVVRAFNEIEERNFDLVSSQFLIGLKISRHIFRQSYLKTKEMLLRFSRSRAFCQLHGFALFWV